MRIWFFLDSASWPVETLQAANTPEIGGSVGGAEAMTILLARTLAAQHGHQVTIWATKCEAPGVYGGLEWRGVERSFRRACLNEPSPDVFVSVRRPEVFSLPEVQACDSVRVLWAQDILDRRQGWIPHLQNAHAIIYMSDWHRQQWAAVHPPVADIPSWVSAVAYDPAWVSTRPVLRRRNVFMYSSRPERGLLPLLDMWPRIRMAVPGATLLIGGYTQGVKAYEADTVTLGRGPLEAQGIELGRADDKPGFYAQLARARLLLYPGVMDETNGHIASAALVAGALPVLTRRGALPETAPEAVFIDGDTWTATYQDRFVSEVVRLSQPEADDEVNDRVTRGAARVREQCAIEVVAEAWHEALTRMPQTRVKYA